jgi:hypothetical protein
MLDFCFMDLLYLRNQLLTMKDAAKTEGKP